MKTIAISGNIGKDATTRTTGNGDKVTSWSVAVEDRNGQDKRTIWFDCNLWGRRGESLAQYLTKGSKVSVSGELSTREHDGKTYLTVRADQVTLMGGREGGGTANPGGGSTSGRDGSGYDDYGSKGGGSGYSAGGRPDLDGDLIPF